MGHGGDMIGRQVTAEEAASGLGFKSVKEMDRFYELMKLVLPDVEKRLNRIFGCDPRSQWPFEIASGCVHIFMKEEANARAIPPPQ